MGTMKGKLKLNMEIQAIFYLFNIFQEPTEPYVDDSEDSMQNEIELIKKMGDVSGDQGKTRLAVDKDKP